MIINFLLPTYSFIISLLVLIIIIFSIHYPIFTVSIYIIPKNIYVVYDIPIFDNNYLFLMWTLFVCFLNITTQIHRSLYCRNALFYEFVSYCTVFLIVFYCGVFTVNLFLALRKDGFPSESSAFQNVLVPFVISQVAYHHTNTVWQQIYSLDFAFIIAFCQ